MKPLTMRGFFWLKKKNMIELITSKNIPRDPNSLIKFNNLENLHVMKYGGTSVGSSEAVIKTVDIFKKYYLENIPLVIVTSAMSGVTNRLVLISELARDKQ